jgi:hypothetical protein
LYLFIYFTCEIELLYRLWQGKIMYSLHSQLVCVLDIVKVKLFKI